MICSDDTIDKDWRRWSISQCNGDDGYPDIQYNAFPSCEPTSDEITFISKSESILTAIRIIYPIDNELYKTRHLDIVRRIHRASQFALIRKVPVADQGIRALEHIEEQILSLEAGRIKNGYMIRLGKWTIILSLLGLISFFCINLISDSVFDISEPQSYDFLCIVWTATMIGAWTSFGVRKHNFRFRDLTHIEEDRVDPPLRLIFCGILTIVASLMLITEFLDISIGNFKASNISESYVSSWLLGLLFGISEIALPGFISNKASSIVSSERSV